MFGEELLAAVVVGGGGGASYSNLSMSSATFATGKYGQALSGGSGTVTLTFPTNSPWEVGFWFKSGDTSSWSSVFQTIASITLSGQPGYALASNYASSGKEISIRNATTSDGLANSSTVNIRDGAWHWLVMLGEPGGGGTGSVELYIDGVSQGTGPGGSGPVYMSGSSVALVVTTAHLNSGDLIDDLVVYSDLTQASTVPSGALTRASNTVGLWHFDGNGTGS